MRDFAESNAPTPAIRGIAGDNNIYNVSHRTAITRSPEKCARCRNQFEENPMEPKTVRRLEEELERPIADVIRRLGIKKLPLLPSHRTVQMMAKAAVAVYEAAVEEAEGRK
jgi:hypothetical protein